MKTSKRLLFGTFAVLLAAPVVLVAYSRVSSQPYAELPVPERTPAAELARLRDFTEIDVNGDFELEIVRGNTWSVDYTPLSPERGNFNASVENGLLTIGGFGNRTQTASSRVRITLPGLEAVHARYVPSPGIAIRNFDGNALDVSVDFTEGLVLENNRYDSLDLTVQRANLVDLRGNSFGSTRIAHFGTTITTD